MQGQTKVWDNSSQKRETESNENMLFSISYQLIFAVASHENHTRFSPRALIGWRFCGGFF